MTIHFWCGYFVALLIVVVIERLQLRTGEEHAK